MGGILGLHAKAFAEDAQSPYRLNLALDLTILGVGGAGWAVPQLFLDQIVKPSCPCDTREINAFDRGIAGRNQRTLSTISDIALVAVVALPFGLEALDVRASDDTFLGWLQDAVVIGETIVVNGALDGLVKLGAQRPRPLLYGEKPGSPALNDRGNYLSFYSGHTSTAFAAGLSYAQTFALRHPHSPYRPLVYAVAGGTGAAIGMLRIMSGKHFPSDVLVGAAIGSALGLVIPWLHTRDRSLQLSAAALPNGIAVTLLGGLQ